MPANKNNLARPVRFVNKRRSAALSRLTLSFICVISVVGLLTSIALAVSGGDLDASFNTTGKVMTPIGNNNDGANAVALQGDGKIVAVGDTFGPTRDFALARYNTDGSLDTTFDGDGKLTTDFGSTGDAAYAVVIQADGKIIAAGNSVGASSNFALARYYPDGSLDTTFGGTGKVTTPFSSNSSTAYAVALQPDGKIVAAGTSRSAFALARYNSNGSLDTSFGGTGQVTTDYFNGGSDAAAFAVAIQTDGKIVAAGYADTGFDDFALMRYNPNGTLDTTFDTDGKVATDFAITDDRAYSVAIQSDGKIVAAGYASDGSFVFALARYNSNGSLDSSFGGTGKVRTAFSSIEDVAFAVAIQSDGKIVVAGYTNDGTSYSFALARYNPDSSLDIPFGNNGKVVTGFGNNSGTAKAIAIQSDGKIVAAGNAYNGSNTDFALARYLPSPGTVLISQFNYTVGEGDGSVAIIVSRTGDTTAAATVNYTTTDNSGLNACNSVTGLASSRCDYATSIGTLRFAAGEAFKTIYIPIIDDNIADGNETFNLALSNPSGVSLGVIASTTITITDNANTTGNPIDTAEFFIRQHYIDFLGREPDPTGYAAWLNIYNNCGTTVPQPCDRIEISSAFFRSPEFQERAYFIYRFYSAVGKIPLYNEFMPDFAKVSGFLSAQELEANKVAFVNEFMTRSDYQNLYGAITGNDAYVTALLNTLGLPNHPGKQAWIDALTNNSMTRAQVLRSVTEDGLVYQKYYNEAFVIMQYFGYLRRSADISYVQWIQTMNSNGGNYREMINGFLNSAEYRNRFQ